MSEHETHADIIAEMRIFKCRDQATGELEVCNSISNYLSDRLEAAHKREVDELQAQLDELRLGIEQYRQYNAGVVKECESKLVNAAKLRKEVRALLSFAELHLQLSPGQLKEGARECCEFVAQCCKSALAIPPRNCDLFNTGDAERDAQTAWDAITSGINLQVSLMTPREISILKEAMRGFVWLLSTAKKGGNDGRK